MKGAGKRLLNKKPRLIVLLTCGLKFNKITKKLFEWNARRAFVIRGKGYSNVDAKIFWKRYDIAGLI
jgi:hypothetical protein